MGNDWSFSSSVYHNRTKFVIFSMFSKPVSFFSVVQLFFSGIAYPGYEIIPGLKFHVFSAPIWFSLLLTVITMVIIWKFMTEVHYDQTTNDDRTEASAPLISFEKLKETMKATTSSGLNWRLIFVCLIVKIAFAFLTSTLSS